jgi:hypothetical protein
MPRGRKTALTIRLTPVERQTLLAWQRSPTLPAGLVRRGRIIFLVSEGMSISAIARTVGVSRRFIYKWVRRFLVQGLAGLATRQGPRPWSEAHCSTRPVPPAVFLPRNGAPG